MPLAKLTQPPGHDLVNLNSGGPELQHQLVSLCILLLTVCTGSFLILISKYSFRLIILPRGLVLRNLRQPLHLVQFIICSRTTALPLLQVQHHLSQGSVERLAHHISIRALQFFISFSALMIISISFSSWTLAVQGAVLQSLQGRAKALLNSHHHLTNMTSYFPWILQQRFHHNFPPNFSLVLHFHDLHLMTALSQASCWLLLWSSCVTNTHASAACHWPWPTALACPPLCSREGRAPCRYYCCFFSVTGESTTSTIFLLHNGRRSVGLHSIARTKRFGVSTVVQS